MRLPRIRFTVRRLMTGVAICALALWIAPVCHQYWWTWTVVRDVKRGTRRASPEGFWAAGPASVRALRETVRNGQKKTRLAAVQTLGDIGHDGRAAVSDLAKPAIPDLIDAALHDQDREVRIYAVVSLGQMGPAAGAAVEPLIELLHKVHYEEDPQMICVILDALGLIGPRARPALPVLASMAKNPQHGARAFAARAMYRIGPEGRAEASLVVPALIKELATGKSPRERVSAAIFLADMASVAEEAIPALLTAGQDQDQEVRRAVAAALEAVKGARREIDPDSQTPGRP